ncbi:MAG: hypothetical protein R3F14_28135 [Polyangiaceae bacterium]
MRDNSRRVSKCRILGKESCVSLQFQPTTASQPCEWSVEHCESSGPTPVPLCSELPPEEVQGIVELCPLIRTTLRRAGLAEWDVADLTQTLFVELLETVRERRSHGEQGLARDPQAFATAAARYSAIRLRCSRRRRADAPLEDWLAEEEQRVVAPDDVPEVVEGLDLELLGRATDFSAARALYAHCLFGVPRAAIAAIENVPPATIETRLRRARLNLQAAFRRLPPHLRP